MPSREPPKPAMPAESANTRIFARVGEMPDVRAATSVLRTASIAPSRRSLQPMDRSVRTPNRHEQEQYLLLGLGEVEMVLCPRHQPVGHRVETGDVERRRWDVPPEGPMADRVQAERDELGDDHRTNIAKCRARLPRDAADRGSRRSRATARGASRAAAQRGPQEVDAAVRRDEGQVHPPVAIERPAGDEAAGRHERGLRQADHPTEPGHDDERKEDDRHREAGRDEAGFIRVGLQPRDMDPLEREGEERDRDDRPRQAASPRRQPARWSAAGASSTDALPRPTRSPDEEG